MPTQVQFRRGTEAQNDAFTGASGELSVDTTNDSIRIHDGTTAGGFEPNARYADLAERYATDIDLEPGDVVVLGGAKEITKSTQTADTRVLGVVSTQPSHKMNAYVGEIATRNQTHPYIALTGRCPCKAVGVVKPGDLMITSDQPGHAQSTDQYIGGAVIGKAITGKDTEGPGEIEVAVGRF
jgi:hypothetical protein